MRVVDSSAWIETIVGSPFGRTLLLDLPPDEEWLMPTIVQFEVSKWLLRERTDDVRDRILAFSTTLLVVPLTTSIAIEAAALGRAHGLAAADAIILATAHAMNADLLTCDAHFEGLPSVVYRAKTG